VTESDDELQAHGPVIEWNEEEPWMQHHPASGAVRIAWRAAALGAVIIGWPRP
jgi:hypothetical protein